MTNVTIAGNSVAGGASASGGNGGTAGAGTYRTGLAGSNGITSVAGNNLGGGIHNAGQINALNTIVIGNRDAGWPIVEDNLNGAPFSSTSSDNLTANGLLSKTLQTGGSGSPGFNPLLANNGGPTTTIALVLGGPADGTGINLTTLTSAMTNSATTAHSQIHKTIT